VNVAELKALHEDIRGLRAQLATMQVSLAGCQAASRARQDIVSRRPSIASAVAAWASLGLALVLALANLVARH
jgi:hypothetical protein